MGEHAEDVTLQIGGNVVGRAQSLSHPETGTEVEVTGLSDNWKSFEIADLEWTMDIDEVFVPSGAAYQALETAFRTKASIAVQWKTNAGYGRSGTAICTRFEHSVSIGGAIMVGLSLRGVGATTVIEPAS